MEKKRRARINESLQELRTLFADTDVSLAHIARYMLTCAAARIVLNGVSVSKSMKTNDTVLYLSPQFQSKMENAEVLEMTVKRVEHILQSRSQGKQ